jgi:putative ABC transport system substrate-binding protein
MHNTALDVAMWYGASSRREGKPMRRRDFITLLGSAAAWPFAVWAQQATMPLVGYLSLGTPAGDGTNVAAFRKGLSEIGFAEARKNLAIEFHWAQNDFNRLPELAADLVRKQVAVIAAIGTAAPLAAKAKTSTIPIVFDAAGDPVQSGLVTSLNRPDSNVTGISSMSSELGSKRLALLHQLLPRAVRLAVLTNPGSPQADQELADLQAAAMTIKVDIDVFQASTNAEIDTAFASLAEKRTEGLLVSPQFLFGNRLTQILALAARYLVPVIYSGRAFVEAGGLMSYGPNPSDAMRQLGIYVGRILKGERPADLPVMRPTRFEFLINLQAAKLLGIDVPPNLLALADEVIE